MRRNLPGDRASARAEPKSVEEFDTGRLVQELLALIAERSQAGSNAGGADILLTPQEAASRMRRAVQTLARWRCEGTGPVFIRVGGRIAYRVADLDAFLVGRSFRSTSAADRGAA